MNYLKHALLMCSFVFLAKAQITINENHFPIAGDSIYYTNFTPDSSFLLTMGAGAVWDMSSHDVLSQNYQEAFAVSSTPFLYQFSFNNPSEPDHYSDYAVQDEGFDLAGFITFSDIYNYYKKESTAIIQTGIGMTISFQGTDVPLSIPFEVLDTLYDLNLNIGSLGTDSMAFISAVPGLGDYGRNIKRHYAVDAEGVLTINGQNYNCIRIRTVVNGSDTIYVDQGFAFGQRIERPTAVQYQWLSTDYRFPVLEINANVVNGQEQMTNARVLDTNLRLSIPMLDPSQLSIYPNPSHDQIHLDFERLEQDINFSVFNVLGEQIELGNINKLKHIIDCSWWPNGIYILNLYDTESALLHSYQIIKE